MALNDDYLNCKLYEGHGLDPENPEFTIFEDEKTGKYYFAYLNKDGKVLLRSEGYEALASREKGVNSIIRNREVFKRYRIVEEGGKFYIVLRAGNNKEIGRSCDFKTRAAAIKGFEEFGIEGTFEEVKKTAKKTTKKKAAAKTTAKKTTTKKATKPAAKKVTKVAASSKAAETAPKVETVKKEVAPKAKPSVVTVEKSVAPVEKANPITKEAIIENLDGFLYVNEYLDRPRIWDSYGITGYVKFQGEDEKHYFGVYNPDATLYLRSVGYNTPEERDDAFELMDSIILLEEHYKIQNFEGYYFAVLFDENEVVAISPAFSSFIDAFVTTPGGRPKEVVGTMF